MIKGEFIYLTDFMLPSSFKVKQKLVGIDRLAKRSLKALLPRNQHPESHQHQDLEKGLGSNTPRAQCQRGRLGLHTYGKKGARQLDRKEAMLQNEVPINKKKKRNLFEKCRQHCRQTSYLKILLSSARSHISINHFYSILLNLVVFSNHHFSSVLHFQILESLFNAWGLEDYTTPLHQKPHQKSTI